MPQPILGPCGGENQPPCPPINSVLKVLADLVDEVEHQGPSLVYEKQLAAAHALIDPLRAQEEK